MIYSVRNQFHRQVSRGKIVTYWIYGSWLPAIDGSIIACHLNKSQMVEAIRKQLEFQYLLGGLEIALFK